MKPVIIRMVVDLPAPFGPRKPSTSPRSTLKEMLLTANFGPNALVRFSTFIIFRLSGKSDQHRLQSVFCISRLPNKLKPIQTKTLSREEKRQANRRI